MGTLSNILSKSLPTSKWPRIFVRPAGGSLKICAASGDHARAEILLPRMAAAAPWLADH
jgi:hypothetical protein